MKHHRQNRPDRLLTPGASEAEIRCDHAAAPFDSLAIEMERKWGVDQLPGLVSPTTAEKYGRAVAHLNAMINAEAPVEVADAATNCIRGLQALDAEATSLGHQPISADAFEYEHEGHHFVVIRDVAHWQSVAARLPGVVIYTMREVAVALEASRNAVAMVKDAFPGAQVSAVRRRTEIENDLNDEIPW